MGLTGVLRLYTILLIYQLSYCGCYGTFYYGVTSFSSRDTFQQIR